MKLTVTLVVVSILQVVQALQEFKINTSSHLVDVLCHGVFDYDDDIVLFLNASLQYNISAINESCTVSSTRSLTITSTTAGTVNITCIHQISSNPVPTIGFLFTDTSVKISNLQITGCGSSLAPYNNIINMTQPYFTHNHSGLFVFHNSSVNITSVKIEKYFGFAVIVKDPRQQVLFDEMNISHSINTADQRDTGLLAVMTRNPILEPPSFTISNSHFKEDYKDSSLDNEQCKFSGVIQKKTLVTFLLINNTLMPNIHVTKTNFTGAFTSGITISMSNSVGSHVTVTGTAFTNTLLTSCVGSALTIYGDNVRSQIDIEVSQSYFHTEWSNSASTSMSEYGPILINTDNQAFIHLKNVTFHRNSPTMNGACMTVMVHYAYETTLILESVQVLDNTQKIWDSFIHSTGLFVLDNVQQIIINGTDSHPSRFQDNNGSVIDVKNSFITLQGHVLFINNNAINGAAINARDTIITFETDLKLIMINNSANEMGGALYIINSVHQSSPICALQFQDDINISSINNTALLAGNTAYVYPLYNCRNPEANTVIQSTEYYTKELGIKPNLNHTNTRLPMSTLPHTIEFCDNKLIKLHSGQTVSVCVCARDSNNNTVYSILSLSTPQTQIDRGNRNSLIKQADMLRQTTDENINGYCSDVKVTIHKSLTNQTKELEFNVIFSSPSVRKFIIKQMKLLECPPGFQLMDHTCQCSNATGQFFYDLRYNGYCNVTSLTISKPPEIFPWIGIDDNQFIIARNCPKENCNYQTKQTVFKYTSDVSNYVILDRSDNGTTIIQRELCLPNRQGIACGQCKEGYSVVFGSNECRKCSNHWLWTLLIYLLAGPVLICILYALRLTLTTGTINGIIFFAQVSYAGLIQSIIASEDDSRYVRSTFVASLNLRLGFPLCFYNGMNEIWKAAISLLFPVYLLTLLGLIIIISRFSTWFSKKVSPYSIQVLVTVVHLSVATLLTAIIDVAIPITVWTDKGTHKVWRSDGSVRYMSTWHALLFIVTLMVVSVILVPYLAILLFGKWFSKKSPTCSIYIRPIQEAVIAPYKEKQQYWFTVRLLFIILLYCLYAFNTSTNDKSAPAYVAFFLVILLFAQVSFRPLKSKLLNVIELLFIIGTAVSFFAQYIASKKGKHKIISVPFSIMVYIAIMIFIGIVIYHVAMVTGYLEKLKAVATKLKQSFLKIKQRKRSAANREMSYPESIQIRSGSFYDTCDDFREPFLGPTTQTINL